MSDVSKTNELIAEAQEHYSEMNGLNSRAAEVMMELVAALEAKTGARVDMSSAVGVEAQLAATRVPVQGEPNDESDFRLARSRGYAALVAERDFTGHMDEGRRTAYYEGFKLGRKHPQGELNDDRTPEFEAIEQELFKHQPLLSMQDGSIRGCKCMDRVFVTKMEDWGTHLAEVFMRLPRATVPDAATGNVRKMYDRACADIQEYSETIKRLEAEVDDWREGWIIARLTKAEAERDAALAAIERVREIHPNVGGECHTCSNESGPTQWPCSTIAALDWAPEPEVKP